MKLEEDIARKRELQQQLLAIQQEIQEIEAKRKKPVLATIIEAMGEFNISPQEVVAAFKQRSGGPGKRTLGAAPPKYRNRETGQTWSGRGKAPRWITDAEAQGKQRDEFLIDE